MFHPQFECSPKREQNWGYLFNETGYQWVDKICGPFTGKTRLDENEEYDPPPMNEGVVNANLKLGVGGREKWNSCMWGKTVWSAPVFACSPPTPTLYCFAPDFWFHPQFWQIWVPLGPPLLGYFPHNSSLPELFWMGKPIREREDLQRITINIS
jgi:hypothetical protein